MRLPEEALLRGQEQVKASQRRSRTATKKKKKSDPNPLLTLPIHGQKKESGKN
jgi:hypothetical protein